MKSMRITLIGYGKMGKTLEQIAKHRNHTIAHIIEEDNWSDLEKLTRQDTDIAIEFTQPESAFQNLVTCMRQRIPVVCGTTGWLEKRKEIEKLCTDHQNAFFYASNFSIGVNLFFRLNLYLARLMNHYPEYQANIEEIHHTEKKDAPSGTAITLADDIISHIDRIESWMNHPTEIHSQIEINSKREPNVPGTHIVRYKSLIDDVEIKHTAHSREGFATGAIIAAEWLLGKEGVFGMEDLMGI